MAFLANFWATCNDKSVFLSSWPDFDETKLVKNTLNIAIQVNGKLRGQISIDSKSNKEDIFNVSRDHENVKAHLDNKQIVKEIYVPNKLVNFVVK